MSSQITSTTFFLFKGIIFAQSSHHIPMAHPLVSPLNQSVILLHIHSKWPHMGHNEGSIFMIWWQQNQSGLAFGTDKAVGVQQLSEAANPMKERDTNQSPYPGIFSELLALGSEQDFFCGFSEWSTEQHWAGPAQRRREWRERTWTGVERFDTRSQRAMDLLIKSQKSPLEAVVKT